MRTWEEIQEGLERFVQLLAEAPRVQAEFGASRGEFFPDALAALAPGAEIRHLEWFFLERPSAALGGVPLQAWSEQWGGRAPVADADLRACFQQSLPGAFEVTGVHAGEGLWVRDLFTQGEHPVAEDRASPSIAPGDLLVGRLYPAGGGAFLLSPAVALFRNPDLLAAVRADLERMRLVRRGVLRVQQLELEHLFHGALSESASVLQPEEVRARAQERLGALGLPDPATREILARVQAAARSADGRAITEILNGLAFETGIDLSSARLVLIELWDQERAALVQAGTPFEDGPEEGGKDARAALAAFDRGRAEGRDLELLFRQLERDLEVEGDVEVEDGPEEDPGAPDFPGVVAAIVTEFLWEVEREQGPERARAWACLESLGNFARDIGVFEELRGTHLLDFSARWVLDESGLEAIADVERLLEALQAFCLWCEERQDLPLAETFGPTLERLRRSVPRHWCLRRLLTAGPGSGAHRVVSIGPRGIALSDRAGGRLELAVSDEQAALLRVGDLVRVASKDGVQALGAGYPAELAEALQAEA